MTSTHPALTKSLYALLVILFLLPIPLGANRPWAWSFFEAAIFILTVIVAFQNRKLPFLGVTKYDSFIYIWLALIIFAALQIVPLPEFIVAGLSPTSYLAFANVDATSYYLSVDPAQSTVGFIKLLSFFCLSLLVLMLVKSEQAIKLLLMTMVASGTVQALYGSLELLLGAENSLIFGLEVGEAATGSFVYKNHYANYLMLCLAAG
ncbi:MAG: polymerase, partial [Glaciecola sp.]